VLFNNAAMAYFNWLEDITDEEWNAICGKNRSGVLPHACGVAASEDQPWRPS